MPRKLTVLVTCKNERLNIRACLDSARLVADELLVADSGSTDGTLEIVRGMSDCRVIEREYISAGDFKNWAIPQARCPWVFVLDADERLTPALAAEIHRAVSADPPLDGFWVYRANHLFGHRIRFSGWGSDKVIRLFRRDFGRYCGETDHAEIDLPSARVGRLRNRMEHFPYWTYDQFFQKFHRYTALQADRWHAAGRRPSVVKLLLSGPVRFLYSYVVRLGFLDGMAGFQLCALTGFYSFMKQARLWQLACGLAPAGDEPQAECGAQRSAA